MTNNDILRRLRYTFDFSDARMAAICELAGRPVTREQVAAWLKREDVDGFRSCPDRDLAIFLNGLIIDRRGKREGGQPRPESRLSNNQILQKLKIALSLKTDDMLAVLELADFRLGQHELSALLRKPGHKNYRECKDQVLRNFLMGLQIRERGGPSEPAAPWPR